MIPKFLDEDKLDNPTPRTPVVLCVDTSGSMGPLMDEVNQGIKLFIDEVRKDDVAKYSVELAVVSFGLQVEQVCDFQTLDQPLQIRELIADGPTPMGAAIHFALDQLEKRKGWYKQTGIDYFQPWFVLLTDGQPTDSPEIFSAACLRTKQLEQAKKLSVFSVGIGPQVSFPALQAISNERPPAALKDYNFRAMFQWFARSTQRVSNSTPGAEVEFDVKGLAGWAKGAA